VIQALLRLSVSIVLTVLSGKYVCGFIHYGELISGEIRKRRGAEKEEK